MRTTLALPVLCLTVAAAIGCTPESTDEGSGVEQSLTPFARTIDGMPKMGRLASGADGDIYLAGTFDNQLDLGGGVLQASAQNSIYVGHLDAVGAHVMSGSTGANDWLGDVSVAPNGTFFVGGTFEGNINFGAGKMTAEHAGYLTAFDADGSPLFARDFVDSNAQTFIDSLAALPDGSVAISARTTDHVDFGIVPPTSSGSAQIEVAVYNPNGILSWQLRFDGTSAGVTALAADAKGHLYLAGGTYSGCQIGSFSVNPYSMFVAEIDEKGQPVWVQQSKSQSGYGYLPNVADITVDDEGSVYVTGTYYYDPFLIGGVSAPPTQTSTIFLVKLTGDGIGAYAKGFPLGDIPSALRLAGAKNGEVLLGVSTSWAVDFGAGGIGGNNKPNAFLARFGANGNLLQGLAIQGGSVDYQYLHDIAVDPDGNPVVLGSYQGTVEVGGKHFESIDEPSSFIARLKL